MKLENCFLLESGSGFAQDQKGTQPVFYLLRSLELIIVKVPSSEFQINHFTNQFTV